MAAPTIDPGQGYLGYAKGTPWTFQPGIFDGGSALASVTATGLPAGMTINSSTGLITCDGTTEVGQYNIVVRATNADPATSAPVTFFVAIEAGGTVTAGSADVGLDVDVDIETGEVTLPAAKDQPQGGALAEAAAVFALKSGDVRILNIRYFKRGVQIDPDPTEIWVTLKEFDPESGFDLGGGDDTDGFKKESSGATAYFRVPVTIEREAFAAALSNYESNDGTAFKGLTEIETTVGLDPAVAGKSESIVTSRTFRVEVERELKE